MAWENDQKQVNETTCGLAFLSVLPDSPPTLGPHFSSPLLPPPPPLPDFEVPFMGESCEDVTYPLGFSRSFFKGVWAAAGGVNFYTMHSCLHFESFFLPFGHLSGTGGQNNGGRRPHSGHFCSKTVKLQVSRPHRPMTGTSQMPPLHSALFISVPI